MVPFTRSSKSAREKVPSRSQGAHFEESSIHLEASHNQQSLPDTQRPRAYPFILSNGAAIICHLLALKFEKAPRTPADLCHHPSPGNDISIAFSPFLLLKVDDSLQQAVKMIIVRVIELLEGIKASIQVCRELGRVIIA